MYSYVYKKLSNRLLVYTDYYIFHSNLSNPDIFDVYEFFDAVV